MKKSGNGPIPWASHSVTSRRAPTILPRSPHGKTRDPREVVYDLMLEKNGRALLMYAAFGYADGNADCLRELICDPITVLGGSDAGAHVRQIIDAGMPTYALTH